MDHMALYETGKSNICARLDINIPNDHLRRERARVWLIFRIFHKSCQYVCGIKTKSEHRLSFYPHHIYYIPPNV